MTARRIVTYTIGIDENGDVHNDTLTHGSSFAEVYRAFISIKAEVERQIAERRNCPFNPKNPLPDWAKSDGQTEDGQK